ncbi:hypothetical protein H7U19_08500 [Hyunsoonleella sp. SJ7]|uniref:Outer membrane protein beta-barrel domain-containing protein n=1 Tax=Hyunsoonleella aquatilis TaxID=2762758 RepID=A0A923H8I0_9FLAO|nr:hypothetical protein [Hyunsoonleella aquatilis]MBC3758440.1 hypothetical protein [Hyunsoonleella aquatilis]
MGDKKHIDRLFQERFKDFEVTPDNAVWSNIEAKLKAKKKKRRVIPIWWRYAGVAALLLLFLTIGGIAYFNDNETAKTPQIVGTEQTDTNSDSTTGDIKTPQNKIAEDNLGNSVISDVDEHQNAVDETKSDSGIKNSEEILKLNQSSPALASSNKEQKKVPTKSESISKENPIIDETLAQKNNNETLAENNENSTAKTETSIQNKISPKTNTVDNGAQQIAENTIKNKPDEQNLEKEAPILNKELVGEETQAIAENTTQKETKTIEEAIEENQSLLEDEEIKKLNKWSVAPNVAPVYFSSLGKGSSIDPQFNNNSKSGEVNMSYGINASYALSDKVTIRSGVNRVNLGYNTNDVLVFRSLNASASTRTSNIETVNSTSFGDVNDTPAVDADNFTIVSADNFNASNSPALLDTANTTINQSLGYIEIPLEIQYALTSKRFGLNVIGGFSSLFLNNNDLFSEIEGQSTRLGEANNINKTSYSANFGLGLNYKVSKRINLNLEPMFKYQINTFKNTSGDFQPFFIGVYTGFGIKF